MTDHFVRLYALVVAVLGFFIAWAMIAAHPWKTAVSAAPTSQVAQLGRYEQRLVRDGALVDRLVRLRAADAAAVGKARSLAAVAPRIVTLPPLTITRTS